MTERTHDELRDLLGAYVLDAVDDDERDAVDRHLAACPACRDEVRQHGETVAMLSSEPGTAPQELWQRIRSGLDAGAAAQPLRLKPRRAARDLRRWQVATAIAASIALLFGVSAAVAAIGQRDLDDRVEELEAALAGSVDDQLLLAAALDPSARTVELRAADGRATARAVVLADGSGVLAAGDLPRLPEDRTYQLWAITGGTAVSAGVLGPAPLVAPFSAPPTAERLAVTAEVAGGAPAPTQEPLAVGDLA